MAVSLQFIFMTLSAVMGAVFVMLVNIMYRMWWVPRRWPIHAPVAMQRGKSIVWDLTERARIHKDRDGYEYMRLRTRKQNLRVPKYSRVTTNEKGKGVYPLFNKSTGHFFPIRMMDDKSFMVEEDPGTKNWMVMELQRSDDLYPRNENKWLKWMPYIMTGGLAGVMVFFVIYYGGKVEVLGNQLAASTLALADAVNKMGASGGLAPMP